MKVHVGDVLPGRVLAGQLDHLRRHVDPDGPPGWPNLGRGQQHVQPSAAARQALLAGQVDPRLLVTLGTLADLMPIHLVAFDDPSPGASSAVPLRGAEVGAVASAGLSAMVAFLSAQQGQYKPAVASITQIAHGPSVVIVRYDAPGPMGLGGS